MDPDLVSPDTLGIAKKLADDFFSSFKNDAGGALYFFSDDASVFFDNQTLTGTENIRKAFEQLQNVSFRVNAYEAQTVPQSNLWSMIVMVGTAMSQQGAIKSFHSTFYVDANRENNTAFIRYFSVTVS